MNGPVDEDDVKPVTPKHTFSLHYSEIVRHVGCLNNLHTNRYESKNAQHKDKVKGGNNTINVLKTMAINENHLNAILKYFGWFKEDYLSIEKLSQEIETDAPYYSTLTNSVTNMDIVAEKITYKNTEYVCGKKYCVLIHTDEKKSTFAFGIITKIIVKKTHGSEIFDY